VIVTLSELSSKTKVDKVKRDLQRCIQVCQRVQEEFGRFVSLAEQIDKSGDALRAAKQRLAKAMALPEDTPLSDLVSGAASIVSFIEEYKE